MILLNAVIYILMLTVPGFIAEWFYNFISRVKQRTIVITGLIFDFLIFIINITGLYIFNDVYTVQNLFEHFNCLHFCRNYGLLSILMAIILGVIFGIVSKILWVRNNRNSNVN